MIKPVIFLLIFMLVLGENLAGDKFLIPVSNAETLTHEQFKPFNFDDSTLIAQRDRTMRIQFKRGANSTVVKEAVVRGTRDIYLMRANASQTLKVSISSVENNAVFDVVTSQGKTLVEDVTSSTLKLPSNGDYKVIIGSTRGNATYQLNVEIQ